jgi:NAD-dependent SIR2 family protein deacetylase
MPEYLHLCASCKHEWEETYRIPKNIKEVPNCPKCDKKDNVKRLLYSTAGKVELTGQDLRSHLKSEGKKEAKKLYTSEKEYAKFIGDDKYQKLQTKIDKDR